MEAKARQTNIKMTARKLRRVINEVRGKSVAVSDHFFCGNTICIFKKYTGFSPSEYRDKKEGERI